jgi:hypothetical protein
MGIQNLQGAPHKKIKFFDITGFCMAKMVLSVLTRPQGKDQKIFWEIL